MTAVQEPTLSQRDFKSFKQLIYDLAGISLADSKQIMVQGRLAKRLRALGLDSYSEYWSHLASNPKGDEVTKFINALTTNKTDFFRENHHFEFLANTAFPQILAKSKNGGPKKLRIWCSASSTGEEPYTIAMSVREFFGNDPSWDCRILASDIDTDVLETASRGVYAADRVEDIPSYLKTRYFSRESRARDANLQVMPILRDLITFRRLNLQDAVWPINTQFDVIFCRNVMIYFDGPSQTKIVSHFAQTLNPDGYLIIGHSESLFGLTDTFKPLGDTIYTLTPAARAKAAKGPSLLPSMPAVSAREPKSAATIVAKNVVPERSVTNQRPSRVNVRSSQRQSEHAPQKWDDDLPKHPIIVGEVHASDTPLWITTLLGSCVATCLYDEVAQVGGMNHFMLPESQNNPQASASFGIHAMELLINSIMKLGGRRHRLQAKIFGGSKVIQPQSERWNIGQRNIEFAKQFLETECIPIVASHTGGHLGMKVQFNPCTAKVLLRHLDSNKSIEIDRQQKERVANSFQAQLQHPDITLF